MFVVKVLFLFFHRLAIVNYVLKIPNLKERVPFRSRFKKHKSSWLLKKALKVQVVLYSKRDQNRYIVLND